MEAGPATSTGAGNGGFQLSPESSSSSHPSRKELSVISQQSVKNSGDECSKPVQSDERLIFEVNRDREPADVDFCSITIGGGSDDDIMQQRLADLTKKREQLQQMEIELRAQIMTREHANENVKLKEQLREKEQKIRELWRKMKGKERELHAIRLKLDNEKAWAKDELIMEQNEELQSYMIERVNTEAEKVQHIQQIHYLQEHIQEKDCLFMELQEQHRIAQDRIIFKDEQLRDAQAWIIRAHEIDVLQTTTNHILQAELRERTEHYNQIWLGCQRQFAEIERLHRHLQQLQLELSDVREKSGLKVDDSHTSQNASNLEKSNGVQLVMNDNTSKSANSAGQQGECLDTNISQGLGADSVGPSANGEKVLNNIDNTNDNNQSPQQISSQFLEALSQDPLEHGQDTKENPVVLVSDHGFEIKNTVSENSNLAVNGSSFEAPSLESSYTDAGPKHNDGHPSQFSAVQTSHDMNGGSYRVTGGSNVKFLNQTKDQRSRKPTVRFQMGHNRTVNCFF